MKEFGWRPKIPTRFPCPTQWSGDEHDWCVCRDFLRSLRWKTGSELSVSFHELAIAFHAMGWKITKDFELTTYHDLYKPLREAIQLLTKSDLVDTHPGLFHSTKPRCCGRVLPQGCIVGAAPFFTDLMRVHLARLFALGAGRTLSSWMVPLL